MDLILEPDGKLASLGNSNNSSSSLNNNNNNNILNNNNNNNPLIKGHGIKSSEDTAAATSPSQTQPPPTSTSSTSSTENNNHLTIISSSNSNSPTAVSPTPNGEAVYEFGRDFGENPTQVISEKVQNLASQIYNELQKIMSRCTDDEEVVVGGLMPLIVNVLESLDMALIENQSLQVELELCKDDNEQLVGAFEKEKTGKKKIEQRLFELEFSGDEEKQHYQQRIDSLANIVKMLELKSKNATDHSSRLEEKESEMKKEYNKIHERYTELLRSHCDLMERVKIIFGNDEAATTKDNLPSQQQQQSSLSTLANTFRANLARLGSQEADGGTTTFQGISASTELFGTQGPHQRSSAIDLQSSSSSSGSSRLPSSTAARQAWTNNSNFEAEMSYDDTTTIIEDVEELQKENRLENRDHSLSGMEKEIENLITENNELLATKNALNIVKDDLITKVDELQSDLAMCNNEIQQREAVQERLKSRISQLEEELKKGKEELEETRQKLATLKEDDEEGVPIAQRKRFTRVEMSRVLMERNNFKEKYFELQDALRWAELSRATKNEDKRGAIWKFFSNFFNPGSGADGSGGPPSMRGPSSNGGMGSASTPTTSGPAIRYTAAGGGGAPSSLGGNPTATPALEAMRRRARAQQNGDLVLMMDSDLSSERARAAKSSNGGGGSVRAHVTRSGSGDRIQAYGWSITGASAGSSSSASSDAGRSTGGGGRSAAAVPVPIYCRPLGGEAEIGMKIWSATAVDLTGGEAGFPITASESPDDQESSSSSRRKNGKSAAAAAGSDLADLEVELKEALAEQSSHLASRTDQHFSTFVWICSVSHSKSKVTVVNIRSNPGEVLDSFFLRTHLLCIASVPGAKTSDLLGTAEVATLDEATSPELRLVARRQPTTRSSAPPAAAAAAEDQQANSTSQSTASTTTASRSKDLTVTFKDTVEHIEQPRSLADDLNSSSSSDVTLVSGVTTTTTSSSSSTVGPIVPENLSAGPARSVTLEKLSEYVAYTAPPSPLIAGGEGGGGGGAGEGGGGAASASEEQQAKRSTTTTPASAASSLPVQPMSTRLPTMWLGGQNGVLYVHSGIAQWSHCIATIHLADSVLAIVHYRGRVFVALANGQCCIFFRSEQTGEWNFDHYYVLDVGVYSSNSSSSSTTSSAAAGEASKSTTITTASSTSSQQQQQQSSGSTAVLYSIRCLEVVKDTVWLGYRNLIFILNTRTLKVLSSFVAHPRKETYVRQLAALGDGVWCSFRLDSTLRLYSAYRPYQHVQNIDIEPYVSKMVTPKSFNFVRITALRASNQRLWIGTSNGVILCLPCVVGGGGASSGGTSVEVAQSALEGGGGVVEGLKRTTALSTASGTTTLTTNASSGSLALGTFMPLCDVSTIQLSFHGHKDNVKFFVCTNSLILSGGEGYVDFRISDTEDGASLSKGDRSHLIVWEITS